MQRLVFSESFLATLTSMLTLDTSRVATMHLSLQPLSSACMLTYTAAFVFQFFSKLLFIFITLHILSLYQKCKLLLALLTL